jgi:hypothetical protein
LTFVQRVQVCNQPIALVWRMQDDTNKKLPKVALK